MPHPATIRMRCCSSSPRRAPSSAATLWQNGFGVVFPELEGESGYAEVGHLDLIEHLRPTTVIPGHGAVFAGVPQALAVARQRLKGFVAQPERHTRHAAKVLLESTSCSNSAAPPLTPCWPGHAPPPC